MHAGEEGDGERRLLRGAGGHPMANSLGLRRVLRCLRKRLKSMHVRASRIPIRANPVCVLQHEYACVHGIVWNRNMSTHVLRGIATCVLEIACAAQCNVAVGALSDSQERLCGLEAYLRALDYPRAPTIARLQHSPCSLTLQRMQH